MTPKVDADDFCIAAYDRAGNFSPYPVHDLESGNMAGAAFDRDGDLSPGQGTIPEADKFVLAVWDKDGDLAPIMEAAEALPDKVKVGADCFDCPNCFDCLTLCIDCDGPGVTNYSNDCPTGFPTLQVIFDDPPSGDCFSVPYGGAKQWYVVVFDIFDDPGFFEPCDTCLGPPPGPNCEDGPVGDYIHCEGLVPGCIDDGFSVTPEAEVFTEAFCGA